MQVLFLLLFLVVTDSARSANILGIVPVPARSHNILFQRLMIGLANAGHNVTFYSHMPQKNPVPNLKEIFLPYTSVAAFEKFDLFSMRHLTAIGQYRVSSNFGLVCSENQLKSKEIRELIASNSSFDVVLAEGFLSESIATGLAYRFKAPLISFHTLQPSIWCNFLVGNEAPSSYIPDPFIGYPTKMSLLQRLYNFVVQIVSTAYLEMVYLKRHQELLTEYFGEDAPPLSDLLRNTSLVLVNDHYSISFPRPMVPNMIPIGGVHVYPPKELPPDLQKYLDTAKDGAILFSLGSNLQSAKMPKEKIAMFLNVFSRLKEKVLWKFEAELPDKPDNVLVSNWFPQSDILAHPNTKLFITHAGLLSTTEALVRGVPIIGIPFFADQPRNMQHSVNAGVGLSLKYDELTAEELYLTIREMLDNPKYREAAEHRSLLMQDEPSSSLEKAIWWTEYVIRHKGATHLRSQGQHLAWYQRYQLDVVLLLVVLIYLTVWSSFLLLIAINNTIRNKFKDVRYKTKKNK